MATGFLAEDIYRQLKERILTFELQPGTTLQEVELARQFEVSRTPVREALRMLKAEGLVDITPGRGVQVSQVLFQDLLDTYEVREWLEPAAAAKAARQLDAETLNRLQAILDAMPVEPHDPKETIAFETLDQEFHDLVLQASGNRLVRSLVVDARRRTQRAVYLAPAGRHANSREELRAILEALKARDSTAAGQQVRRHIVGTRARLMGIG